MKILYIDDKADIRTLLGRYLKSWGYDAKTVRDEAKSLGAHEFIYIKTRGVHSKMVISQVKK